MGLRKGMWGKTTRIEGDLKNTQKPMRWKLPKRYEENLNEVYKNEEDEITTGHLLSPYKVSDIEAVLYPVEQLAKGVPWNSPNNSGC